MPGNLLSEIERRFGRKMGKKCIAITRMEKQEELRSVALLIESPAHKE